MTAPAGAPPAAVPPGTATGPETSRGVAASTVVRRRLVGLAIVVVPVGWALARAGTTGGDLVNTGGLRQLGRLLASAGHPDLSGAFLVRVADAAVVTVVFAALGTAGALVVGLLGGVVLSERAWSRRPPLAVRLLRGVLRGALVAVRSVHEIVWALLLLSVLGLDPLVAVLAIALPFGAQTAKVFGETFDNVPSGALLGLRHSGARPVSALAYGLLPAAAPVLTSYSFYRFECAIRSAVVLGVVGVGGLGQELVVSLQSRNWDEVWTLIGAVVLLSAVVDAWSGLVRAESSTATCAEWSARGQRSGRWSRLARVGLVALVPALGFAWLASGVSLAGLVSPRSRELGLRLATELWPPALPAGGGAAVWTATLDTLAMALLAMVVAVLVTAVVGPWATRPRRRSRAGARAGRGVAGWQVATRWTGWGVARMLLLVLRSVPAPVWAVLALLALFPGILPGALALGLYTGGILGRLVAEAWESLDRGPLDALVAAGTGRRLAALAAVGPASVHHLTTYTLYRFEICVRDTAVVGVVGAAGLGRLLSEQLSAFRFPVVTTVLAAFLLVSGASEIAGRRLRAALRA
ncbi:MAG: ABC transporter permease subunit [Nocardioidaceae bacterium]